MSGSVVIQTAGDDQIEAIMSIERANFHPPWSEGSMLREIYGEDSVFLAATDDGGVAGFCVLRIIEDEAELLNLAVDGERRRMGIAASLLRSLLEIASLRGVKTVFLEARASNLPAILLYEKLGFSVISKRKNYYDEPVEDAVIMRLKL